MFWLLLLVLDLTLWFFELGVLLSVNLTVLWVPEFRRLSLLRLSSVVQLCAAYLSVLGLPTLLCLVRARLLVLCRRRVRLAEVPRLLSGQTVVSRVAWRTVGAVTVRGQRAGQSSVRLRLCRRVRPLPDS